MITQELNLFMEKVSSLILERSPSSIITIGQKGFIFVDGIETNLSKSFSSYIDANPASKSIAISNVASKIIKMTKKLKDLEKHLDWENVKKSVLPVLIKTKGLKSCIPRINIGNNLSIIYQVNESDRMISLTNRYCKDTKINIYELDVIARKNLTKRDIQLTTIKSQENYGEGLIIEDQNNNHFTTSHLLRNDLWYKITDIFKDRKFLATIPNHKTLFLFTKFPKGFALRMLSKSTDIFEQNPLDNLDSNPFLVTRDGFSPYDWNLLKP